LHRIQKHFLTSIKWNCCRGYVCFQYLNAWKQSGYLKPPGCKLLIMGLPGSGKTTLARTLAPMINAVHFNADEVRAHLNKDLGYSVADRIEQATRMGWLCDQIVKAGMVAIADFVCPTRETRTAFKAGGNAFVVWIDRIDRGRFEDTNRLFTPPGEFDVRVWPAGSPQYWAEQIAEQLRLNHRPRRSAVIISLSDFRSSLT
jgi:energy-coupling factor transporter ATP-binding protein EcfA2